MIEDLQGGVARVTEQVQKKSKLRGKRDWHVQRPAPAGPPWSVCVDWGGAA